jgi:hypothetical protein
MFSPKLIAVLLISSSIAFAQKARAADFGQALNAQTTLPIAFTKSISADHAKVGDAVLARTTQNVRLINGFLIPSGTKVAGHVLASESFVYDKTPYAQQKQSTLSIRFDSLQIAGASVPVNVTVRAMADPITSWDARESKSSDLDSLSTVTQIGGDQLIPSQSQVVSRDGDVVAYNKKGGVYAHLIANGNCDASSIEVSVGVYSASACGLYGFTGVSAEDMGSAASPSTLTLVSTHTSPKVWKHSTALLEVLPNQQTASR